MRRRRVGERAELGEVTAAGERRSGATQLDPDGLVGDGNRQRVDERGAQRFVDGVVAVRTVQRDDEPVAVALDQHGSIVGGGGPRRWSGLQPPAEVRTGLERRVHGRLGGQPEGGVAVRRLSQQHGQ